MHSPEHLRLKIRQFHEMRNALQTWLTATDKVEQIQPGDYERFQVLSEDMLALIDFWGGSEKEEE